MACLPGITGKMEMKLQCSFYDEAKAELEKGKMLPNGGKALQRRNRAVEKAYRRRAEKARTHKRVLDQRKYDVFENLALRAMRLAEFLPANLRAETWENGEGTISLETDLLLLEKDDPRDCARVMGELFEKADDIFFSVPDGALPRIAFTFTLCNLMLR